MDPIENDGFPGFVVLSRSEHVLETGLLTMLLIDLSPPAITDSAKCECGICLGRDSPQPPSELALLRLLLDIVDKSGLQRSLCAVTESET